MIDRIAKLLNKAERAATPEEAQTYFDKAQALATAHSISLAKARLRATGPTRLRPISATITIGTARKHANRHLVRLFLAVAKANDLKVDIAHNSTYVIVYGYPDDQAAAQQLWSRISTQMIRFGEAYLATGAWRSEQRFVYSDPDHGWRPMTKQTARSSYYQAFVATIAKRLQVAREDSLRRSADQDDPRTRATSTELALRAKELEVMDFYSSTSRARGSWGGAGSMRGTASESAQRAGVRDGRRASVADPASLRGAGPALEGG